MIHCVWPLAPCSLDYHCFWVHTCLVVPYGENNWKVNSSDHSILYQCYHLDRPLWFLCQACCFFSYAGVILGLSMSSNHTGSVVNELFFQKLTFLWGLPIHFAYQFCCFVPIGQRNTMKDSVPCVVGLEKQIRRLLWSTGLLINVSTPERSALTRL